MVCEQKMQQQLSLEGLGVCLVPKKRGRPPGKTLKRSDSERKQILAARMRAYRAAHPERHKAALKRYNDSHKEQAAIYRKNYGPRRRELYQLRKKEIVARKCELAKLPHNRQRANDYLRRRRKEEPQFALADAMRATMNRAFRRNWIKKPARTEALLGCTISEAKVHIESQFKPGMTWEHRASFVVDHFVPVVAFDLRDPEEARLAFNWRNLQPLTPRDNATKQATLPTPLPSWLPAPISTRILERTMR